jgi:hypothetical protein
MTDRYPPGSQLPPRIWLYRSGGGVSRLFAEPAGITGLGTPAKSLLSMVG